jgi:hypothetical protein
VRREADRRKAIGLAVSLARAGDTHRYRGQGTRNVPDHRYPNLPVR